MWVRTYLPTALAQWAGPITVSPITVCNHEPYPRGLVYLLPVWTEDLDTSYCAGVHRDDSSA